ncbi:response regulator [Leifsonia kafniensis]
MVDRAWKRTALVVEDQPLMRALIADALRHAGFTVHDRASAGAALADFDDVDPDVLITDIDLGSRPNGIELAVIVNAKAPQTAIVFLTNYPRAGTAPGAAIAPRGSVFVNKAAIESVDALIHAVNAALTATPEPAAPSRGAEAPAELIGRLTRTQLDTLRLVALGSSNAEIARQRATSLRALEKTLTRTFDALGLTNDASITPRVAATNLYLRVFGFAPTSNLEPAPSEPSA